MKKMNIVELENTELETTSGGLWWALPIVYYFLPDDIQAEIDESLGGPTADPHDSPEVTSSQHGLIG